MRKMVALSVCVLLAVPPAGAVPGGTTTDVNFRTGPGTQNPSLGVLAAGTPLDIVACNEGGIWCSVDVNGESGFVSGHYLQETAPPVDEPAGADVAMPGDDDTGDVSFSEAELDELVAPIALYPDSLLTQVLVAATVPLDIVKAERWVEENEKLATEEREAAAAGQGWEESVAVLAAGFPEVIEIMAGDLDWTEDLGEAVLIQNDDVLDAVQRQRARAQAVGNLETNEAQVVASEDDAITIAPAKPDVVYVPQYDPVTTYTTPVATAPVYVEVDDGYDTGAILATGAIAFGAGLAINSVFNSGYRNYWYGPNNIVWNQNNIYPRPVRPVRPGRPGPPGWHGRPGGRPGSPDWVGRPGERPGGPNRPGRPGVGPGRPDAAWRPDSRRREEARRNVRNERRQGNAGQRPGAGRPAAGARPAGSGNQRVNRQQMESKLKARSGNPPKANRPAGNRPAGSRPAGSRPASAARKGSAGRSGAVSRPKKSSAQTRKAANRGKASASRKSASRPAARTQQVRKPRNAQPAKRRASPNRSAFSRSARPGRTSANSSRGRSSRGGGGRGRGGGGRGRR